MASIWDKFREWFGGTRILGDVTLEMLQVWGNASSEHKVRELAFQTAVGKISRSLSKCEIKTYIKGEEKMGADYYRLNVAPNMNQDANAWMNKLLARLMEDNEALVVEVNKGLHVADSFNKEVYAMKPWVFNQIMVDDYKIRESHT